MLNVYWPKRQIAVWLGSRPVIANVEANDQPCACHAGLIFMQCRVLALLTGESQSLCALQNGRIPAIATKETGRQPNVAVP
jgi:hypothetical protein|tara:strand:+ start:258 stop:500 length:243 start_codon:yes stop_codon:yes gene_type:complete